MRILKRLLTILLALIILLAAALVAGGYVFMRNLHEIAAVRVTDAPAMAVTSTRPGQRQRAVAEGARHRGQRGRCC